VITLFASLGIISSLLTLLAPSMIFPKTSGPLLTLLNLVGLAIAF
jgi:hypothetical protein